MTRMVRVLITASSTLLIAGIVAYVDLPLSRPDTLTEAVVSDAVMPEETAINADVVMQQLGFDASDEPVQIEIRGRDFHWAFRYPGPDRILTTDDDVVSNQAMHLPLGATVHLHLESDDYLYFLSCPTLELREIAMRGLTHSMPLVAINNAGKHPLRTDPMCGYRAAHDDRMGIIVIEPSSQFVAWGRKLLHSANKNHMDKSASP